MCQLKTFGMGGSSPPFAVLGGDRLELEHRRRAFVGLQVLTRILDNRTTSHLSLSLPHKCGVTMSLPNFAPLNLTLDPIFSAQRSAFLILAIGPN